MQISTLNLTLDIRSPLGIALSGLPDLVINKPYSLQCTVSGGVPPYTWTASGLPVGLAISPTGLISGIYSGGPGQVMVSLSVSDSTRG